MLWLHGETTLGEGRAEVGRYQFASRGPEHQPRVAMTVAGTKDAERSEQTRGGLGIKGTELGDGSAMEREREAGAEGDARRRWCDSLTRRTLGRVGLEKGDRHFGF